MVFYWTVKYVSADLVAFHLCQSEILYIPEPSIYHYSNVTVSVSAIKIPAYYISSSFIIQVQSHHYLENLPPSAEI